MITSNKKAEEEKPKELHEGSKMVKKYAIEIQAGDKFIIFNRYYASKEAAFEGITRMAKPNEIYRVSTIYIRSYDLKIEDWDD